jgi:crotonobetainyl-CoA:carnitine CoA-transferase CaiB-like acyl-CoA transferase
MRGEHLVSMTDEENRHTSTERSKSPLENILVLDLTTNIAGPFATQVLSDLGATIWKVERPNGGDDARQMSPVVEGQSAYFTAINLNKKSIALDLKAEGSEEVLRRLVSKADVVIENFRTGVAARLGLRWEAISKTNKRAIFASISGYGEAGPESSRAGYDALLQARTGLMAVTGRQGEAPVRIGVSILDMSSGIWAALAIVTALYERERTGLGRRVRTSLFETGVAYLAYHLAYLQLTGKVPPPQGSDHLAFSPYGAYSTGENGFIFIGVSNDRQFEKLSEALGHREWTYSSRFKTNADRVENKAVLRKAIEAALSSRPAEYWEESLAEQDIAVSRLRGVEDVLHDPQAEALAVYRKVAGPHGKAMLLPRLPISLGDRAGSVGAQRPPRLGENTEEILSYVGFNLAEIRKLQKSGVAEGPRPS